MIDRFLRRLSVRQRIVGGFLILVALVALFAPLILVTRGFILGRLQEITEVEARADRLLLLAAARVESSRVNLMRYIQDYAPSAYEALDDVDQAAQFLEEAQSLLTSPEQKEAVGTLLVALDDYRALAAEVEALRSAGLEQDVSRTLFQAYRLGRDIGQRIEQIVADSEERVVAANEEFYTLLQNRMILLGVVYVVVLILAVIMASLIQRSITRPVAELREGAEAFRQGDLDVEVPVVGSDELSLLAQIFNEMAAQLRELIGTLEQRVADRTRDLERRAVQLSVAADVGRVAASILDQEVLTRQVVELVRERFDLYYAGLFLLDDAGQSAVLAAGTGEAGRMMMNEGHRLAVGGRSMVGMACARRQARLALDVGDEPHRFDNPLLPDTRSEVALPLVVGAQVLGALDVQSTQSAAFSQDDVAVLQLVANQVAVAIQNARLFAEAEAALEAERRLYGEISREAWSQLARAQAHLGYSIDERGIVPTAEGLLPQMESALRAGRPVVGQDAPTTVAIPIRVRDEIIGVIDAEKPDGSGAWSEAELGLLETMIEQLGVALDSARLYEDTQRRAAREQLIGEVTGRMRQTLDVDNVLRTAAQEMLDALGLARAEVWIGPDQDGAEAAPETTRDNGDEA
jgi:GAF domain-containing protein/HAMP domain-containing protein